MSRPRYFRSKHEKEAARRERKNLKLARKLLRREQVDSASSMQNRQPPMVGTVARAVREID